MYTGFLKMENKKSKMLIGLHDAEKDHFKKKSFPNYALMKISAWHKAQGDQVEWWNPLKRYDRIYSSKVLDFTPVDPYLPEDTIRGGTGYRDIPVNQELPKEIDDMLPDYSIYPECDYAIGYLTRGCPNHCRWCVVPEKEGNIRPYRTWREIVRADTDKLVLMDNNILACEHGVEQLIGLIGSGYRIDLNQGMDARLVDDEIADILSRLYLLVTENIWDASDRVEALKGYKGINLYAQAERNERMGIIPNKLQLEFQNRYIYGGSYRNETWEEYCERKRIGKWVLP